MLEREDRSAYASIAIGRILEKRPDGSVVLDPDFIPCHLNVVGISALHRFINEMSGLMRERAKILLSASALQHKVGLLMFRTLCCCKL